MRSNQRLPAPVDHRHRETAVAQVAHGLEIFLDLLAAPGEDANRALAAGRRRPARKAQFGAIRRLDGAGDDIVRDWIGGNRDERPGGGAARQKALENKGGSAKKAAGRRFLNAHRGSPISPSCRPLPVFREPGALKAARKPGPMAGGFMPQSLNGGLFYAYLPPPPVLPFHRRLRPAVFAARQRRPRPA